MTVANRSDIAVSRSRERIEVIECLRGFAAVSVCWFHFTNGNSRFLAAGALKTSGQYGWLGVEIFFVLSGFVVPYSLYRAGYVPTARSYGRFLWKRVSRLDPPYLFSIAVVLALGYVSTLVPGYRGSRAEVSTTDVLVHFGYLNAFAHKPWLNVVYWSLAIEFQYYLLIGLLFRFLTTNQYHVRFVLFSTLSMSALVVPGEGLIFKFFFLFIMGFSVFQRRLGLIGRAELIATLGLALAGASRTLGALSAATGLVASAMILSVEYSNAFLKFLGQISYSLYLVHVPIGGRVINLGERTGGTLPTKLAILTCAMGSSIFVAYMLYRWIETPCRRYSSSLRFGGKC